MAHRFLLILRRRLFNFLTILSLLLCLATIASWTRSYWRTDLYWQSKQNALHTDYLGIGVLSGRVVFFSLKKPGLPQFQLKPGTPGSNTPIPPPQFTFFWYWARQGDPGPRLFRFLGFGSARKNGVGAVFFFSSVWFPHWFPALLFAILPAVRLRSLLHTRRHRRLGLCPHCGYDLRASPDRCPECGHLPKAAAVT